jgi:hypothetical protein
MLINDSFTSEQNQIFESFINFYRKCAPPVSGNDKLRIQLAFVGVVS